MTDYIEFAAKIKEKYPQYKDVDDLTLAQKVIEKYPQYKEQVTFEKVQETPKKAESKGIDLTPSGMVKKATSYPAAALRAALKGEDFNTALDNTNRIYNEFKPAKGLGDLAFDLGVYSKLPMLRTAGGAGKAAQLGRFAGNAAIQGGLPGALEGLKNNELGGGATTGTTIAAALQSIPGIGRLTSRAIQSNAIQKELPKALEFLTSVPAEYTERALEKELAGKSILNGKFDPKTAYRPIEAQLRKAKSMLPTPESYAEQYKELGNQVREKLNAETMPESWYNEQYNNLGAEINKKMQDYIKPESYFDTAYNRIGQKFLSGIENLKTAAGNELDAVLEKMGNTPLNINGLKNAVESTIKSAAKGGEFNPAEIKAGKDLEPVRALLNNPETKPINLHNAKELLYDTANYETTSGIKNNALKGVANQINNFLRNNSEYAKANDKYANILDLIKGIGGDDSRTIATRLRDYGTGGSIRNGSDSAFRSIEELLPFNQRFMKDLNNIQSEQSTQKFLQDNIKQGTLNNIAKYDNLPINQEEMLKYFAPEQIAKYKDLSLQQGIENNLRSTLGESILNDISKYSKAPYEVQNTLEQFAPEQVAKFKEILEQQNAQNEILKTINQQAYERNPKLLANRHDEGAENALNYLQEKSGINFMDKLNDIRAREALEAMTPGQGGGSGTAQGFGNLLRTALIGGSPTAAILTGNPAALLGLASVSPKIMAKGTIKNIGKLSDKAQKAARGAYDNAIKNLSNIGAKGLTNMLYGGVEYNDYQ